MKSDRINLTLFLLAVGLLLCLIAPVWADEQFQSNDMNTVGGDIKHESKAFGFGRSSFDVDINDCMGSVAWDTILVGKQRLVLNKWCAAEVYDAKGLHHMAAVMRCDVPEISKHFPDAQHCIVANKWSPPPIPINVPVLIAEERWEEEDEYREEQQTYLGELESRMDKLDSQRRTAARVSAQKAAEQKAYAQQTLDDLEQYR